MDKVRSIDVELTKENIEDVIRAVAAVIRPEWSQERIKYQIFEQGNVNLSIGCHNEKLDNKTDAFVIKTNNDYFCGPLEEIRKIWSFLNCQHLGCQALGFIRNGICMNYLQGEILSWNHDKLFQQDVMQTVAEETARWHSRDVYQKACAYGIKDVHWIWNAAIEHYDEALAIPEMDHERKFFPTKEEMLKEITCVEELTYPMEPAFCHGDISGMNMSLSMEEKKIVLFDYDFTGIAYVERELAFFFFTTYNDVLGFEKHEVENFVLQYFNDDYERTFLRYYLETRAKLDNGPDVSEITVENLFRKIQIAKLFVQLRLSSFGVFHHHCTKNDVFILRSKSIWASYPELKRSIIDKYT